MTADGQGSGWSHYPRDVVDEDGRVFALDGEPIGCGGQGVVFRTRDPDIAVKFVVAPNDPSAPAPRAPGVSASARLLDRLTMAVAGPDVTAGRQAGLRARIEDVRSLPLPRLHIARPLSLLRTYTGYTMQLLRGMVPLGALIARPGTPQLADFYRSAGGLRRRLHLLTSAAALLARLHGVPVVYADFTPSNVFVSATTEANEVWLIDADNLAFESVGGPGIYTLGYGAPELVQGAAGVTTLSDAWSFAVVAFQVLTQIHPFLGDHVEDRAWDDDDGDRETRAFAGQLPWIDDPADPMNTTSRGVYPRDQVISPALRDLFTQMFGPGRVRRSERPSAAVFVEALRQAGDLTLRCPDCGWTFFVKQARCPRCPGARRPAFLYAEVRRVDPGTDEDDGGATPSSPIWRAVVDAGEGAISTLHRHAVRPTLESEEDPPAIELRVVRGRLIIAPRDGGEYWLGERGAPPTRVDGDMPCHLPIEGRELRLQCGPRDAPGRIVSLRYWDEAR